MRLPAAVPLSALVAFAGVVSAWPALASGDTVIAGAVEAKAECASAPMEAWLSVGSTLLYQVEVPQHGTFEFHVRSGSYNLVVIGASGCLAEKTLEARENETQRLTLEPVQAVGPKTPENSHAWLDWLLPSALADCPFCNQGWYVAPPVSFMPMQQPPWWMGYGAMTYPNFAYPGPWAFGGIDGNRFPGQGMVFGAKPVVYVEGPEGTEVKIRARLNPETHWLVAVPEHGQAAWSGKVHENRFVTHGADYRYLFYDYRADHKHFQDTRGFCTRRGELIPKLSAALRATGFRKNEVEDFSSFWSLKIPDSERYCVYPQTQKELKSIASLEVEPKPAAFTQLLFVVQLGENLDGKGKFRRAPVATWNPEPADSAREPAQAAASPEGPTGLKIREWGIGFLEGRPPGKGSP